MSLLVVTCLSQPLEVPEFLLTKVHLNFFGVTNQKKSKDGHAHNYPVIIMNVLGYNYSIWVTTILFASL